VSDVDTNELSLRVQGAFSAGEMRGLLQRWGLSGESAQATDAARLSRELVRAGQKSFGLAELVRRLRTERPLVEWPEVSDGDIRFAPRGTEIPGADATTSDELDAVVEPSRGVAPTLVESDAAANEPAPAMGAAAPSSAPRDRHEAERVPTQVRRPLVFEPSEPVREPSRGIEPKLVIVALGLVVLLAGIAFAAGVAYTGRASSASSAAGEQPRPAPSGPAARAAALLSGGLEGVARLCAIDPEARLSHSVFVLAREDCGDPRSRVRRPRTNPRIPDLPPEPARPSTEPEPTPEPPRPANVPLPAAKSGCVSACQRVRQDCNRACGAEPSEASLYDAYNACKGRCLAAESRCRLSCN
jgi:hypothetical protein